MKHSHLHGPPIVGNATTAQTYDVVVAGGGPAGCAATLVLARAGHRVLLADAGTGPPKLGETLVPAARLLLGDLGVAERVPGGGHLPCYGTLSAWGTDHLRGVDFIRDPYGLGWHLDRALFDRRLRSEAAAAGADVAEHTSVRATAHESGRGWTVVLSAREAGGESGREAGREVRRTVRCAWVVDATGRAAAIAVRNGARHVQQDRLITVRRLLPPPAQVPTAQVPAAQMPATQVPATTVRHPRHPVRPAHQATATQPHDPDRCALVEAAPDGWWYTSPAPCGGRLVGFFTDAGLLAARRLAADFHDRLLSTRHVAERVLADEPGGRSRPRRAAAHTAYLDRLHGAGWVAAGDGAVAFDPLSSQGVLTALYTGLSAGQAVHRRLQGDRSALDEYAEKVTAARAAYHQGHRAVYAQERRWPDHPFWAQRAGGRVPRPAWPPEWALDESRR